MPQVTHTHTRTNTSTQCKLHKYFFSLYSQDSNDIYLCKVCTDSLILAYTFWQKVKQSEEKLFNQSKQNLLIEPNGECIEINDIKYTIESVELKQSDKFIDSEQLEALADEPMRKKYRKRKLKSEDSACATIAATTTTTNITSEQSPLNNIAFPHFVIANLDREPNTIDNDEIYCEDGSGGVGDANVQRKQVKTLKPSAIIPSDLNKINELLSMSPLENDTDTKSTIFKCSHCPKAYAAPHHLMVHLRKSHLCQYCLATFIKITDLYGHVKEMHRTFECLLCGKEFQSNGNLRQHMRKHHSIFLPAHISLLNVSNVSESDTH